MLPSHYFEIICCPFCRGELAGDSSLKCDGCAKNFPIIDGIPVLLAANEDEVSRSIAGFYQQAWKRDDTGELQAKRIHEDVSRFGQRYINDAERRFDGVFVQTKSPRFFLDAACGAQPRIKYGRKFRYHVCVDFSLDGLTESRRLLGERAICVCGSLLQLPIKNQAIHGVLASHCLYHIEKDLQADAIFELLRVLAADGTLLILYGNPNWSNTASRMIALARALRNTNRRKEVNAQEAIYIYLHSMDWMLKTLSSENGVTVSVRPLCAFTRSETEPIFKKPVIGRFWFGLARSLDILWRNRPERCYYVAYTATRQQA